jgi:hypothetical protein
MKKKMSLSEILKTLLKIVHQCQRFSNFVFKCLKEIFDESIIYIRKKSANMRTCLAKDVDVNAYQENTDKSTLKHRPQ